VKVSIKSPKSVSLNLKHPGFVLVGMMRSGSNFLERQLNRLADVRCHGELFNPTFVGLSHEVGKELVGYSRDSTKERDADEMGFLRKLDDACDRALFGSRLFLDHSPMMTSRLLHDPAVKKIVLSRNLLEAYVSLTTAVETGVWLTTEAAQEPSPKVKVNLNKLVTFALRQSLYYNDILTILHRTKQAFVQMDYTEIKQLPRLNAVAELIGSKHRFADVQEPIHKQSPEPLEERIEDFPKLMEELRKRQIARWLR
jgi:LPS sulfotransferase NodH